MTRWLLALSMTWFTLWSTPAFAQGPLERATELKAEADELYGAQEFARAALLYAEAYELVPDPVLLGTESVAWYQAGDCETSLVRVDEYAQIEELPPQLHQVRIGCAIRASEASFDRGDYTAARASLDQAERFPDATDRQLQRIDTLRRAIEKDRADGRTATSTGPSARKVIGASVFGVGVVTAAASVFPALAFKQHRDEFFAIADEARCTTNSAGEFETCARTPDTVAADAARAAMARTRVTTWLLIGSGAAVGAIGAILFFTKPSESTAQLLVGPSSVGVHVRF